MQIVKKDLHGQIHWKDAREAESLDAFASKMEIRHVEMGLPNDSFSPISETTVEHRRHGTLVATYHACDGPPMRLL